MLHHINLQKARPWLMNKWNTCTESQAKEISNTMKVDLSQKQELVKSDMYENKEEMDKKMK